MGTDVLEKTECNVDEEPTPLVIVFPGSNDRCIGVDWLVWAIERHSNSEVICFEYGHKLESVYKSMRFMVAKSCLLGN